MTTDFKSPDTSSLPPIHDDDFIPPIDRWRTFGAIFVVAIAGVLFPLAALLQYKVTVKSNAIVRPKGEVRLVQAATEGQIQKIFVKENQAVEAGEAIAAIDNSRLQTKKVNCKITSNKDNCNLHKSKHKLTHSKLK